MLMSFETNNKQRSGVGAAAGRVGVFFKLETTNCPYLGGQKSGQVDFRDHFAPSVPFPLVRVVMVLDQVPEFCAALEVRGDHWGPGTQAVWTASRPQHALWNEMVKISINT